MQKAQNIVFFDGVCNLCNGIVNILLELDTRKNLLFAPLQGETFRQLFPDKNGDKDMDKKILLMPDTIIFYDTQGSIFTHSDAVLRTLAAMGGVYQLVLILLVVPRVVRDFVYRFIAHNRYRFFGKRDTCRVPTPELLIRFLP